MPGICSPYVPAFGPQRPVPSVLPCAVGATPVTPLKPCSMRGLYPGSAWSYGRSIAGTGLLEACLWEAGQLTVQYLSNANPGVAVWQRLHQPQALLLRAYRGTRQRQYPLPSADGSDPLWAGFGDAEGRLPPGQTRHRSGCLASSTRVMSQADVKAHPRPVSSI